MPFIDGRWHGNINVGPDGSGFKECWASTAFADGTVLSLSEKRGGKWNLQLSNPGWELPASEQYLLLAMVDFYPKLQVRAKAKSRTSLEIEDLTQNALLEPIENGHTIELVSDGFHAKYDLEGSAKVIQRIRECAGNR